MKLNYNNILKFAQLFLKLSHMSKETARNILEVSEDASLNDIKSAYRSKVLKHHPDRGGSEEMMKKVNEAFEILSLPEKHHKHHRHHAHHSEYVDQEPVEPNFRDLRYCKKYIKQESEKNGPTREFTLWNFDGSFFRDVMTVETNEESFPLAASIFERWIDFFKPLAIFVSIGDNQIKLLKINGQPVHNQNKIYIHDSFNANPGNDQSFVRELRKEFENLK